MGDWAEQFWETQVIADDNPAFYAIQHKGGYLVARSKVLVLLGGSKEMDFVVGGYIGACAVKDIAGIINMAISFYR